MTSREKCTYCTSPDRWPATEEAIRAVERRFLDSRDCIMYVYLQEQVPQAELLLMIV